MRIECTFTTTTTTITLLLAVLWGSVTVVQAGWVDPDTPVEAQSIRSLIDGSVYNLVMSDEFNVENRTFADGHDPTWTALDKSDDDMSAGGGSLHFYNSSRVRTEDGFLKINTRPEKTAWNHYYIKEKEWKTITAEFSSGMVQSWNKFCFTGGIIEIEVTFPGIYNISGLWPAVWLLGNLGRATYEPSTNNIWPWSYNTCDKDLQHAQKISACNAQNHYGLNSFQGRGSTEIDFLEIMSGKTGWLPSTNPKVEAPYASMTLQSAPGVTKHRPSFGYQPNFKATNGTDGHPPYPADNWYRNLKYMGNTSINPFFYGTYLGETKPEEPVQRSKKEAFQADAISAMHQLTKSHFEKTHKFRLEWQPGPGGRIDWFSQGYKVNETYATTGDGMGTDWIKAYSILDKSLKDTTGSNIPQEPSYLIFNTAVSSTWGFPYDPPSECVRCYDCNDPTCACAMPVGFCEMLKKNDTDFLINYVRIYQSPNPSAHVGQNHSLGCDPMDFPTREYIKGNEYLYMRPAPWVYNDIHSLKPIMAGGGKCKTDEDCGGVERGYCVSVNANQGLFSREGIASQCKCHEGSTGPHCLTIEKFDDEPGALEMKSNDTLFHQISMFYLPNTMSTIVSVLAVLFVAALIMQVRNRKVTGGAYTGYVPATPRSMRRPNFVASGQALNDDERKRLMVITGTSV